MNEIRELESGIDRLRRDSQSKKMLINALEKEKTELLRRSDELSDRLTKTSEAYKESSRKIMDYVNSQVSQLRMDMAGLSSSMESLSGLEKRLESQEKSHERTLNKIGKELIIVEKSLSDVDNLKTELSRQQSVFQDAKLRMEKSVQSGMVYLRKEMDVNRRDDARKALEEFKQEIERISSIESELNAYKRSQESRVDSLTDDLSSLKSSLADLRVLKERSKSLEDVTRSLEDGLSELSSRQKAASSLTANELSGKLGKGLESLKKDLESRRAEDTKAQLREFKQELQRVASLEQGLKENSKRLDSLGRELSSLQPAAEQVAILQDKVDENLHMNHSLADRTVSSSDFERAMRTMTKRAEELESKLF
ncbi:MAG: hypothetical protein KAT35_01155, partial [Candidatus Aenigmarchaeota archaeon]|nr:hypothetical protein [Candidatus Aenigmarchaeota archaeon]